jgi:hypothetical protein
VTTDINRIKYRLDDRQTDGFKQTDRRTYKEATFHPSDKVKMYGQTRPKIYK